MKLRKITSSLSTFKSIEFVDGMNLIIAERSEQSRLQDTRNGVGKSTLVEILHFCLGAETPQGKGLRAGHLAGQSFSLEVEIDARPLIISRAIDRPGSVLLDGAPELLFDLSGERLFGAEVKTARLNEALGSWVFGLESSEVARYWPSFRSLISYLMRRGTGAFLEPFSTRSGERTWQTQVNTAYLCRLGWRFASNWQELRERERVLTDLRRAADLGTLEAISTDLAALEAEEIRQSDMEAALDRAVAEFRVEPQYRQLQSEADKISSETDALLLENIRDRRLMELYRKSVSEEKAPEDELDIRGLYATIQIDLGDAVQRTLEQAHFFHQGLIQNRRDFLESEITRLNHSVEERDGMLVELDEQRAEILGRLSGRGALEELTELQRTLGDVRGQLQQARVRIEDARRISKGSSELRLERESLYQATTQDLLDRTSSRRHLISAFSRIMEELYGNAGLLIVECRETSGYHFGFKVDRQGSHGVERMAIYAFDASVCELWSNEPRRPEFLVHDSLAYDGVDERQRALALHFAHQHSLEYDYQYIAFLNSDELPYSDFPPGFDIDQFVRLRLTDERPEGRLLGFRY